MTGEQFLQAIESINDVRRLALSPTDTVVLMVPEHISEREFDQLYAMMLNTFRDRRVLVLDSGMEIGVLEETAAAIVESGE
jgi:hypothetical protein